jgi:hypothetical protein
MYEVENLKQKYVVLAVLVALAILVSNVQAANTYLSQAESKICSVMENIYELLLFIAGGLGALVIIVQGLTWVASADDAKARKNARMAVIHVLIGLIIISLSLVLVAMVLPTGADCVVTWPGWPGNST